MIRIAKGDRAYCEAFIQSLKARVSENDRSVEDKVAEILKDVRDNGDEAVRRYTMKFDGWAPEKAEITKEEIDALTADCDPRQTALLTQCADAVENHFGTRPGVYAGSTDCNIPLANGIPAAAIGLCIGAGEHTRGEWIETESLKAGFKVAAELISARFLPEEKGE